MRLLRYLVRALSLMILLVVCHWLGNITYPYLLMNFGTGVGGALAIAYVPLMILYLMDQKEDD